MDITQLVIVISLSFVTITLVFVGVWAVLVLTELRNSLKKVNRILENAQSITDSVVGPVSSFSEFLMGFKNGFTIFNKFFKDKKDES